MKQRKRWRQWLPLVVIVIGLLGANPPTTSAQDDAPKFEAAVHGDFVAGEVLVGFRQEVVQASSLLAAMDAQLVGAVLECEDSGATDASYRLRVPAGREWEAIAQLEANPDVLYAEPNWLVYAADRIIDAALAQPETPFLVNDPNYIQRQWYLQRIGASRAWGLAQASAAHADLATIQVAVVDSGIDPDHPEFAGNLLPGKNYVTPGNAPVDRYGHGTHVAGLIGAMTNNNIGVAGIAPQVKIDPRKVLGDSGGGTVDNVARGICEAADAGAHIINLSLETPQRSPTLEKAVRYADSKGALLIGASGNSGLQAVAYPAAFAEVMAVGATTYNDMRASYSNFSSTASIIEISAPGGTAQQSMYNTWAKGAWCGDERGPLPTSGYCTSFGTSMAAAVVTGAAALVWSMNSDLSADEVRALLRDTAAPIAGSANEIGSGRIDIQAAARRLMRPDLQLSYTGFSYSAPVGAPPYTASVRIDNPSGQPIAWEAGLLRPQPWMKLVGADDAGIVHGDAEYGKPGRLTFRIAPTGTLPGVSNATTQIVGTRNDTSQVVQNVFVELVGGTLTPQVHLNMIMQPMRGTIPPAPATWETPSTAGDRTVLALERDSAIQVLLPFSFTLRNTSYTDVFVNANGFVSFDPADATGGSQSRCLPNRDAPGAAIYGWWAALNPKANGARISTFQPAADRFVIEYEKLSGATDEQSTYVVNFQIVLHENGDIGLNYGKMPTFPTQAPRITVGVEARDGLLYNQITCNDGEYSFGYLPDSYRSFLLKSEESVY
ncbi:MAG: S8 family serine peptidase [Caldilineaceae bacterium]|nr:S8 family serine peptidase [Caldilineaceae bacterium]